jgi:protein-S-isoprenylcysteine O-methyltransferase Ste14
MTTPRFFEWFQLGALACLALLGLTRALLLRARGVRILVGDWQRTPCQMIADTLGFACLLAWAYEIVAYGWPLAFHIGPVVLACIVVQGLATKTLGAIVVCLGVSLYAIALYHLGASWRLGLDRAAPGPLVVKGIYGWTRHPIYLGFDFMFVGTFLVLGRLIFLPLALVLGLWLHAIMCREEHFLTELYGDAYRDYSRRVGRYFFGRHHE